MAVCGGFDLAVSDVGKYPSCASMYRTRKSFVDTAGYEVRTTHLRDMLCSAASLIVLGAATFRKIKFHLHNTK